MSNEIFGVDIAQIVNNTFKGNLLPLTVLTTTTSGVDDFGVPITTPASHAGEGVRSSWDVKVAVARGYPLTAVKILVLQNGIPEPTTSDQIAIMGDLYRIVDVRKDPVDATWSVAAVKV